MEIDMHFKLLDNLTPDHYIKLTPNGYVVSADDTLLKQINLYQNTIEFNLKITDFFFQFNRVANKLYSESFITNLSDFISDQQRQYALLLLNGCCFDNPDVKGFFLFIVRKVQQNEGIRLELYNVTQISDSVSELFTSDFWNKIKQVVKNNMQTRQLYLAHESLLSFFLLTNLDESNIKLRARNKQLDDGLFYFNFSENMPSTSDTNIIKLISENNLIKNMLISLV